MKRKILLAAFMLVTLFACAFGLSACGAQAHTHSYSSSVTTAATCTKDGVMTYACSCGDSYTEKIPATGHTSVSANNGVAATCTTSGKESDTVCSVCGETLSTGKEIPALGHSWNEGEVTTEATCTEAGVKAYTCTVCGETKTEKVAALGHTEAIDGAVAPTCTETGLTEGSHCSVCGAVMKAQEVVPATGHNWNNGVVTKGATCTAKGVKTYTCAVCGETKTEVIAAKGHTAGKAVKENEVAATCTKDGSYDSVVYCSVCKTEISRQTVTIAATGHTSVSANNGVAATCTTAGKESDTVCSVCGETLTTGKEIPAAGHTPADAVKENEVAATCTKDGSYDSVVYCSVCKGEISREKKTVTALGHSWNEGEVTTEATCTEAGVKTFTCTVCGETKTEEVTATGHTEVTDIAVAPTCTETGLTEGSHCSVCNEVFTKQEVVPALGHDYDTENIVWTWSTDHTSATATLTCKNDETHTQVIEATVTSEITQELTATAPGIRTDTATIEFEDSPYTATATEEIGTEGLAYILNEDGESYTVSGIGTATDTAIVIPSTYKGLPVTGICAWAFDDCTSLTSVTIGNNVKYIDSYAFSECSGLTSIVIPDSVTSIGSSAFYKCSELTNVTIGNGVMSIGWDAFSSTSFYDDSKNWVDNVLYLTAADGKTLYLIKAGSSISEDYEIADGTKVIAEEAFAGRTKLTSIVIPDSVESIDWSAFRNCTSLTSIVIPDSVTSIGSSAFSSTSFYNDSENWVDNVLYLTATDGTTLYLIEADSSISGDYEIAEGTKVIAKSAFSGCSGLTSIVISDSVTSIGNYAFLNCSGLTSIVISNSVTSIGDSAFSGCTGLTSIDIPDSVTSIDDYAFSGCSGLTSIDIPDSVESIGDYAFSGCSGLTSIVISDSVTSIGNYAFLNCSGLTSVKIGSRVESIGDYAFSYCSELTSIVIPDGVTSIGENAFCNCLALTSITVDEGNETYYSEGNCIIERATGTLILGCQSSVIPDGVTSIGEYAFYQCSGLTSIVIPNSVTSIGNRAFLGCNKLVEVYNLSSLTITSGDTDNGYVGTYAKDIYTSKDSESKIFLQGDYQFYADGDEIYLVGYQGSETDLILPDNVQGKTYEIYQYAFYQCSKLTSVTIGENVTSIGDYAFSNCSGLTGELVIPNSVTSIGYGAFLDCSGLTSVTIGEKVESIGDYAFSYCSRLTSVTIGENVTRIGSWAFNGCSLTVINYAGTEEQWNAIEKSNAGISDSVTINYEVDAE